MPKKQKRTEAGVPAMIVRDSKGVASGAEGPAFESRLAHGFTPRTLGPFSRKGAPMILGMSIATFTLVHTVLSLVGIVAGLVVAGGLVTGTRLNRWAVVFVVTTVLANASGFGFPSVKLIASHVVGAVSLVVLPAVIVADYVKHFAGRWRTTYAVGVVLATYLNVFVLVAQLFKRIPVLFLLAPTQSEPPFAFTQVLVLALFVWLGVGAVKGFRPALGRPAP